MTAFRQNTEPIDQQKAVIYCRVSGAKQVREGDGLASQETRNREYARMKNYAVTTVFADDMTGGAVKRPAMDEMLAYLRQHRADNTVVIIDDISRLARGLEAHLKLRALLAAAGGKLESPSIEFGEDSDSILVENLLASVAQHQREKNGEQTKNRMRGRMMNGYWVFQAPVGYRYEKVAGHGKLLVRDEPVASIVTEALERFAAGGLASPVEVKRFLQDQPDYPKGPHGTLLQQRVSNLLTRPIYAGYISHEGFGIDLVKGHHEPLISLATWQKIQDRLNGRAKAPTRADLNCDFPLRNFVLCGECGAPYRACWSTGKYKQYPYYLCQTKGCPSRGKSVRKERLEGEFEEILLAVTPRRSLMEVARSMLRQAWDCRAAKANEVAVVLKRKLVKVEKSVAGLLERVVEADSAPVIKAYERKIRDLEIEKAAINEKIVSAGQPLRPFDEIHRTLFDFLANPLKLWRSQRLELQRIVLKLVFADPLAYARNEGYRTPEMSCVFKVLERLNGQNDQMVRMEGLEPPRLAALGPKPSASTSSATSASACSQPKYWSISSWVWVDPGCSSGWSGRGQTVSKAALAGFNAAIRSSAMRAGPARSPVSPCRKVAMAAAWKGGAPWARKAAMMPESTSPLPAVAKEGGALALMATRPPGSAMSVSAPLRMTTTPALSAAARARSMRGPSRSKRRANSPS